MISGQDGGQPAQITKPALRWQERKGHAKLALIEMQSTNPKHTGLLALWCSDIVWESSGVHVSVFVFAGRCSYTTKYVVVGG